MRYADSRDDFISRVKNIEHRADQCIEHFTLLTIPSYVARWTILSTAREFSQPLSGVLENPPDVYRAPQRA